MTDKEINVSLSHQEKVFWPHEGYTKGDLLSYYKEVAPFILPYLKGRPETLKRYPNGIEEPFFFQKEATHLPPGMSTAPVQHEGKIVHYLLIEDLNSLLYAINLGCIDLNPFNSRFDSIDYPDYLIMDLDPLELTFDHVILVAQTIHKILEDWEVPSVCKTSGATGLHIYIPLGAQYTFEETQQFSKMISLVVHEKIPDITSLERMPNKREKKVYLDYLQNRFGQTTVAPYSVRPRPEAPVSTPLKWEEVKKGLKPTQFTIKNVLKRFDKVGDLWKPVLGKGINLKKLLKTIEKDR